MTSSHLLVRRSSAAQQTGLRLENRRVMSATVTPLFGEVHQREELFWFLLQGGGTEWEGKGSERQTDAGSSSVNSRKFNAALAVYLWTAGHGGVANHMVPTDTHIHTHFMCYPMFLFHASPHFFQQQHFAHVTCAKMHTPPATPSKATHVHTPCTHAFHEAVHRPGSLKANRAATQRTSLCSSINY